MSLILEPNFECIKLLGDHVGIKRDEFSRILLNVMISRGTEIEGIKQLITTEITCADDPNILFRGNSVATKIIDNYMKIIGSNYLRSTLKALIENLHNSAESFEV